MATPSLKDWAKRNQALNAATGRPNDKWAGKGTSANDFPAAVKFDGKTFGRTGKIGKRMSDGTPTAEYRNHGASGREDDRVWHGLDGKTMRD